MLLSILLILNISNIHAEELPSSYPALPGKTVGNFIVIDPKNPPTDGLWISWPDVHDYAYKLSLERADWERRVYLQQRAYELEKIRRQFVEKQSLSPYTDRDRFWRNWGMPIGLAIGMVLATATTITVYEIVRK